MPALAGTSPPIDNIPSIGDGRFPSSLATVRHGKSQFTDPAADAMFETGLSRAGRTLVSGSSQYVLGHSEAEIERLQLQAKVLEGPTRRLIRECGVRPGMRVLDIGCGAGDVSMLVADVVGPGGTVVAVDRERHAIDVARSRAEQAGYGQIEFDVASDESFERYAPFDAAIGRYVLVHQRDPAQMVRRAATAVKPGGIVAFLEGAFQLTGDVRPPNEIYRLIGDSIISACRLVLPAHDVAGRIIATFEDAGLPNAQVIWDSIVAGADSLLPRYVVASYRVFLPIIRQLGFDHSEIGDPATLYERLLATATASRAQFVSLPQVGAWAVRP
jgi:SAM-dependent methyltransferase